MSRKVAITGIGLVSAAGVGLQAHREAWFAGPSVGGEPPARRKVEIDAAAYLGKAGLRSMDRATRHALVAAKLAWEQAGLTPTPEWSRLGISMATTYAPMAALESLWQEAQNEGPQFLNPGVIPYAAGTMQASQMSIRFGACGPNLTFSGGAATGLEAIRAGAELIRAGDADVMLVGGSEAFDEGGSLLLDRLGLMPPAGSRAGRPYDPESAGIHPGEAAAILVLESDERARERGTPVLGWIGEGGSAVATANAPAPLQRAAEKAIRGALGRQDGTCPAPAWVMGGGNGLAGSDASELAALGAVFGEASPAIAALKAITGECICASGPLQVAAAVLSFEQGTPAGELVRGSPGASASGVLCSAVSWEGAAGALMVCAPGSSVP